MATDFPPPAERERIIARRLDIFEQLLPLLVKTSFDRHSTQFQKLLKKYGNQEVQWVLDQTRAMSQVHERIGVGATAYRHYRRSFARFGGDRPFLSKPAYERLLLEYRQVTKRRQIKALLPLIGSKPGARERDLSDRLLLQVEYWEDLTPPAVPPRPADFEASPPGHYSALVRPILAWGWSAETVGEIGPDDLAEWRGVIPELVTMVFDDGLLDGWPGESASWAPFHALHLLGRLQAGEYAADLLALLNRENDWLSDQLPFVWGQMGAPAEAALRIYLDEPERAAVKRGLAMLGLKAIAEHYPKRRPDIIKTLINRLQTAPAAEATANGYLVYILNRMKAIEAKAAIDSAFAQKKVDRSIIHAREIDLKVNG
jgi:hypothetical protein